jgi:hypothetical protein
MKDLVARLIEPLLRFRFPGRRPCRPKDPPPSTYPYSCEYVAGPTGYRTGERPPRGEDSPLVRPYLVAFERESAAAEAARAWAEARRHRARQRALWCAVHGVDVGPRPVHGVEVVA